MTGGPSLPDDLGDTAFTRSRASGAGIRPGRLRRKDIIRPYHGVQATAMPSNALERCRAYSVRLKPGQFFSHGTDARLHGFTMPTDDDDSVLHVGAVRPADAPHSRGIRGHRLLSAGTAWHASGLPVPDPFEVFCELGAALEAEDLTVIADEIMNLLGDDEERIRGELIERIALFRRAGATRLTRAAKAARRGSRSPAETRVRLVLERAGLPRPELNAPILHPVTGAYLGSPDFVWRRERVVLEYEGDHHRLDRNQFRYDIVRYEDLGSAGWQVLRATGDDLTQDGRRRLARRVAKALGV